MPAGTKEIQEIEIILEDIGGGGGSAPPPAGGDDGESGKRRNPQPASSRRYYTAIGLGIVSIFMFFMALAAAFLVRRTANDWVPVHLPAVIWVNTLVLLCSSATLEVARKRLAAEDLEGFRNWWRVTTALGVLFLAGQLWAWRKLVTQGVYVSENPASSFFYIFTGAHGLHILGGVAALIYVLARSSEKARVSGSGSATRSPTLAAEITSYYWHFMDGLWLFLLMLLAVGK
jgi:cytochrome c oxidase subunit III